MSEWESVPLGTLMPARAKSIDPRKTPDELFELHSIPAHDHGTPEIIHGRNIGSTKQIVSPGDTLLSKLVPHIRRAHIVEERGGATQIASSEWIVFRGDKAAPGYLRHFLVSDQFHTQFMATVSGVGGSLLRARPEHVKRIEIPIPSLEEQRRIATILDGADAIRTKRRAQLAHFEELKSATHASKLAEGNRYPSSRLGDFATLKTGPFGSSVHREDYVTGGVPLINPTHLIEGLVKPDAAISVPRAKAEELSAFSLKPGDVVLARRGQMGRAGIFLPNSGPALCGTGSMIVRPNNPEHGQLIASYLNSPRTRRQLEASASGVTMLNINQKAVLELPVPENFSERAIEVAHNDEYIRAERDRVATALRTDEELFATLQHRAFRGEL
nr:restriction endonuclease subunit S [Brachybacterium sp. sponge]